MKNLRQDFQDRLGDAGTQAEESLSSIRTVRTFTGEKKVTALYGEDVDKSYKVGKKLAAAGGNFPSNSLLNNKLKALADDKIVATQKVKVCYGKGRKHYGKGENAGYQHFLLFP